MSWKVQFTKRAEKGQRDLPGIVRDKLRALVVAIEVMGPVRGDWPNYGKLADGSHHCHLKGGRPTFVACWRVVGQNTVEVYYAGTHEKAPY